MTHNTKNIILATIFTLAGILIVSLPFWTDINKLQYATIYIVAAGFNLLMNPTVTKTRMVSYMDDRIWLYPLLFGLWAAIAIGIFHISRLV